MLGTLKQTMHFDRFPGHVRIYLLQYYTTQHALISKRKKNLGPQIGGSPKKKKGIHFNINLNALIFTLIFLT